MDEEENRWIERVEGYVKGGALINFVNIVNLELTIYFSICIYMWYKIEEKIRLILFQY